MAGIKQPSDKSHFLLPDLGEGLAEAELIEAARFYEQRIHGLGARFLDSRDRKKFFALADSR